MKNISVAQHVIGIPVRSPRRLLSSRSGPRITEMLKSNLGLGAKFLQVGGAAKTFRLDFCVTERKDGEGFPVCYLITTAGPIAGLLFISTHKVAFCSDITITISSPMGESIKILYKVVIPLKRIQKARESKDSNRESKKYLKIVTTDNFAFWFTGFQNHQRMFECLQKAVSQVHQ